MQWNRNLLSINIQVNMLSKSIQQRELALFRRCFLIAASHLSCSWNNSKWGLWRSAEYNDSRTEICQNKQGKAFLYARQHGYYSLENLQAQRCILEDAEDSLRSAVKLLSVFGLIFGLSIASIKLGVSISLCNSKYLVDKVALVSLLPFPQDTIQTMGTQQDH